MNFKVLSKLEGSCVECMLTIKFMVAYKLFIDVTNFKEWIDIFEVILFEYVEINIVAYNIPIYPKKKNVRLSRIVRVASFSQKDMIE